MLATSDPKLFFMQHPPPLILDEIQYVPEIFPYIKRDVDEHRGEKGRFILSGSQSFSLMQGVTETLAGRTGILTLLSMSEMAREIGIAVNTVKTWFSILEASFQIVLLKPYYENLGKRLVKIPKLYFLDPAIPAYLAGLRETEHAIRGPMGGALFENAVFAELYRTFVHHGEQPRLFFWRTAAGHEVDFILDLGHTLVPIEVKLTATPKPAMAKSLEKFSSLFERVGQLYLISIIVRTHFSFSPVRATT